MKIYLKNICVTFLPFLLAMNSLLKFLFPSIFCQHKGLSLILLSTVVCVLSKAHTEGFFASSKH